MANISYYELSKKTYLEDVEWQKKPIAQKEVIIGIFISQKNRFRIRTGIKVDSERFCPKGCEFTSDWKKCNDYEIKVPKDGGTNKNDVNRANKQRTDLQTYCSKIDKILTETQKRDEERLSKEYILETKRLIDKYNIPPEEITYNKILELEGKEVLQEEEEQKELEKLPFFELINEYRDNSKKKVHGKRTGDKSDVWKKNFDVLVRALKRYEWFVRQSKNKEFALDIDTISKHTLSGFESFLRDEHKLGANKRYHKIFERIPASTDTRRGLKPQPRGNNTICALFNKLKAFFAWCLEEGKTTNNPFIGFTGVNSEIYGLPYYITLEERNQIADFDLSDNPSLEKQRDIFIFQCCVGCRVSDLMRLEPKDIINGELVYTPQKTKGINPNAISVPLNDRAMSIVRKYSGINKKKKYSSKDKKEKLLPFVSSQTYNESIKKVFKVCGITRSVSVLNPLTGVAENRPINEVASSHMARRCFVGNLYQEVQDPALIASMSGHSEHSRAFSRYRKIDDELKKKVVNLIN